MAGETQSGGTRTVTDATGAAVEVPADPQRVVTLHYAATQAMLDLGAIPVGMGNVPEPVVPVDQWAKIKDIPQIKTTEPDIEAIAALEPDLILLHNAAEEDVAAQLAKIAPVYKFTLRGGKRAEWDSRVKEVADALNRSEALTALQSDFGARLQEIATKYADTIRGKTVGAIASFEENNIYVWGAQNMPGTLLIPLGFQWSQQSDAAVAKEKEPEATISNERIGQVYGDVDVLFFDTDTRAQPSALMQAVQQTPLYAELPAVKTNQAFPFGKTTIAGYGDAYYSLGQIEQALQQIGG